VTVIGSHLLVGGLEARVLVRASRPTPPWGQVARLDSSPPLQFVGVGEFTSPHAVLFVPESGRSDEQMSDLSAHGSVAPSRPTLKRLPKREREAH
jgi:hypothetical protein